MKYEFVTGQRVVAQCSGGERRQNVVWDRDGEVVYLCSERQYAALRKGEPAPPPIGFLNRDVAALDHGN